VVTVSVSAVWELAANAFYYIANEVMVVVPLFIFMGMLAASGYAE